jgi:DNA-binding CsgD family transcriptional regulator
MNKKHPRQDYSLGFFHFRFQTTEQRYDKRRKALLKQQLKPFLFFIGICLIFSQKIISQNTIKNNAAIFSLSYFKENKNLLNEEVLLKDFKNMPKTSNFGIKNGTYWFKLTLNKTKVAQNLIAYIPTHNVDLIDVYQLNDNHLNYINSTGNSIIRDKLPIDFKFPAFKVNSKEINENIYFLKVNFPKEANFPIRIIDEKGFLNHVLDKKAINSFYYGTIIIIVLLNIFFFIKFRDRIYLYYLFLLSSLMSIFLFYDGSLIHLFRANGFYYKLELLTHISTQTWFLLFSIKFLNLKKRMPNLTKGLYLFPLATLCFYVGFLITKNYTIIAIADTIGIIIFPILWFCGIYSLKTIPSSKFYVLGYLLMVPLSVLFVISYPLGISEVHGDMLIVKIASWLDVIVFTYAISYRVKTKIVIDDLSIQQLQIDLENVEYRLSQKTKTINPYLMLLKENNISTEPLTLKEVDILKYLNEGHNNKEISEKLFISPNTVKSHIKNIYNKVNVNNRLDLKEKTYHITN